MRLWSFISHRPGSEDLQEWLEGGNGDTWLLSGFSCSVPRGMLDCEIFAYQLCWPFSEVNPLCTLSLYLPTPIPAGVCL